MSPGPPEQSADCCVRRLGRQGRLLSPQLSPFTGSASSCFPTMDGGEGGKRERQRKNERQQKGDGERGVGRRKKGERLLPKATWMTLVGVDLEAVASVKFYVKRQPF